MAWHPAEANTLASVYILETGLVQNAPSASLTPALWMLSSWHRLVFDAVPYTIHSWSSLDRTMALYSNRRVSLSPPHFKCATTQMRLRASMHSVFSALMCFLKERCESHQSPRNFVDSSTGRGMLPILAFRGCWTLVRGAVKCTTLHLWAANLKPFPVAHSCMALTACCKCLYGVQGAATKTDRQVINKECSEDIPGDTRRQHVDL